VSAIAHTERASERVHDHLRGRILDGRVAPGDSVGSERALAEQLGVNRHAVREALKRLEQAGLVRISQGGATRVLDWRESGGLEVLLDLLSGRGGPPPVELARSVLEMRETIGVDAARRCATRASASARAAVAGLAEDAAAAIGSDSAIGSDPALGSDSALVSDSALGSDPALVDERYMLLWQALVAGSENVAYGLALNSLLAALAAYEVIADAVRPQQPELIRALGRAIAAGDGPAAATAARDLLEPDVRALVEMVTSPSSVGNRSR
jgi:GntR family transcriptional regulator, transcriptional repressor for pyruvate dehydrogenase complex